MTDFDITARHHRGNSQSGAAHSNSPRGKHRDLIERYVEMQSRGATAAEAERALGLPRQTATARFSDVQFYQTALPVEVLHKFGMFLDIEERRGGRVASQVLIGRQQVECTYGMLALHAALAATVKPSRAKGAKAPIEAMTDSLWKTYRYVDRCGRRGSTADEAQRALATDQSNSSARFSDLRKIKALIPIKALHRVGEFRGVTTVRPTRQGQSAAVLVSLHNVLRLGVKLTGLMTREEMDRLTRLILI